MVGFGAVGQASLPLVLRHIDIRPRQITIVTANDFGKDVAAEYGIKFRVEPLTRANYIFILERELGAGDFLVNVSFDVSSIAVVEWCQQHGVLYIDACRKKHTKCVRPLNSFHSANQGACACFPTRG